MKALIWIPLLALAGVACQPQTTSTAAKGTVATPPVAATPPAPQSLHAASASLPLSQQVDLSYAWSNAQPEAKANPTMEGFYGPDHYRISFYFSKVRRDSLRSELYHIQGINR